MLNPRGMKHHGQGGKIRKRLSWIGTAPALSQEWGRRSQCQQGGGRSSCSGHRTPALLRDLPSLQSRAGPTDGQPKKKPICKLNGTDSKLQHRYF